MVEICPVSNQMLKFTPDLRWHPGVMLHNMGVKISLNSDDPGVFNTRIKAYDYLAVAVAWEFDLKDFKVIGYNEFDGTMMSKKK